MRSTVQSLMIAVAGMVLAACGPSADGSGPEIAAVPAASENAAASALTFAAVEPGTTWVAYEIKNAGTTLVHSYCAAEPDLIYFAPVATGVNGVCTFSNVFSNGQPRNPTSTNEITGFNPPGSAGGISQGKRVRLEFNDGKPRIFQLFSVVPGRYFPALLGFGQNLQLIDGFTPYIDVKAGKVNYIGSYDVPFGADIVWKPDDLRRAIAAQDQGFDLSRINAEPPQRGKVICPAPEKSANLLDFSFLKRKGCYVTVLSGGYFR